MSPNPVSPSGGGNMIFPSHCVAFSSQLRRCVFVISPHRFVCDSSGLCSRGDVVVSHIIIFCLGANSEDVSRINRCGSLLLNTSTAVTSCSKKAFSSYISPLLK
ncbi:hypothetical protein X798_03442 [Onchocerca flexuosa]|uniref:Secreted protein n=2 Tax=Onchocerca flexuosa TaxID=387005 RepID=A0A183H272_9BILA|nr:hypothetical protein X798_03442 [Onchocerca flexuosa]VDO30057.1 unnamed protein product [Onchocerca flexuosa]